MKNFYKDIHHKVCYITAIYGKYESSCKPFKKQTLESDFICFTDAVDIKSNGWIIDNTPYHIENKSPLDNDTYINSITNNKHTFNIAKYYKQSFQNIPRLKDYDIIIWLDGTIEIIDENTSKWISKNILKHKIIGWEHEYREGKLLRETEESVRSERYSSTFFFNQSQPYQDVIKQYFNYLLDGYDELFGSKINSSKKHLGVWITCFVAFDNKNSQVAEFLDTWYLQTLKYTTQDQIGFSYVCHKLNLIPYTLPDNEINGNQPHFQTDFYIKHNHGQ